MSNIQNQNTENIKEQGERYLKMLKKIYNYPTSKLNLPHPILKPNFCQKINPQQIPKSLQSLQSPQTFHIPQNSPNSLSLSSIKNTTNLLKSQVLDRLQAFREASSESSKAKIPISYMLEHLNTEVQLIKTLSYNIEDKTESVCKQQLQIKALLNSIIQNFQSASLNQRFDSLENQCQNLKQKLESIERILRKLQQENKENSITNRCLTSLINSAIDDQPSPIERTQLNYCALL